MDLVLANRGKFRANENANVNNALRLVDPDTPGTPEKDTGDIDASGGTNWTGVTYTGKDGVAQTLRFFKEQIPTAEPIYEDVSVGSADDLRDALLRLISKYEVLPVVKVTLDGSTYSIEHVGSGTLGAVFLDGSSNSLSRASL